MNSMGYYGYGHMGHMGYGWGIGSFVLHVILFIIVVAIIVWVVRLIMFPRSWRRRHWRMHDDALDTLKGRYAKGEIDKKEFEEKKKDLES